MSINSNFCTKNSLTQKGTNWTLFQDFKSDFFYQNQHFKKNISLLYLFAQYKELYFTHFLYINIGRYMLYTQQYKGTMEEISINRTFNSLQDTITSSQTSLVAKLVKNLPSMQETLVQFLGWADPLEKGKATPSSILAWRIPWTGQSMGSQRIRHS